MLSVEVAKAKKPAVAPVAMKEIVEIVMVAKAIDEEANLPPEERQRRRNEKLQAAYMLSDIAAEKVLRNKKVTDVELSRVVYKYQQDTKSLLANKNRLIKDPAPNSRPHRSKLNVRRAVSMDTNTQE